MSTENKGNDVNDLSLCCATCCVLTGMGCKYPDCWGCGSMGVCCCFKQDLQCCRLMDERKNEEGRMFLCTEGGCFLVKPTSCVHFQDQCCCLDTRCAVPSNPQVPCLCTLLPCCAVYPKVACFPKVRNLKEAPAQEGMVEQSKKRAADLSDTPVGEIRVVDACCCSICGFMCKYPQCIGCKQEGTCCCLNSEQSMCKPVTEENEAGICCICVDGGNYCVMPRTCCEFAETCFCIDYRCALPCTDKVPCIFTILPGCVVCASKEVKFACCPKVSDLIANIGTNKVEVM